MFTQVQIWPWGIVIAYVCVCVCVNAEPVRAVTHHALKLEPTQLDNRCRTIWLSFLFFVCFHIKILILSLNHTGTVFTKLHLGCTHRGSHA